MKKRSVAIVLSLVLVFCCAVGGVLAWLTDKTDKVENTFTVGNIDITLEENAGGDNKKFKMVPGDTITKDPKVTVETGSEACWLFVEVEESDNLDTFITYSVADGWETLDGVNGVYYRAVDAETAAGGYEYSVLAGDQVTVKGSVTKDMMDDLTTTNQPTLTFTAYACQMAGFDDDVAGAWEEVNAA